MRFLGFTFAPAAHGGIFMNGVLPVVSILFALEPVQNLAQTAAVSRRGADPDLGDRAGLGRQRGAGKNAWIGDILFVIGAVFFSFYIILSERWSFTAMQIIFCGTVVNAILYLPIWAIFLPSGIADAPLGPLLLQAVYQGFVPNLIGLLFIAHASRTIGNANTSSILAAVPGGGGLLGALILGEELSVTGIVALALLTVGLLISVRERPNPSPPERSFKVGMRRPQPEARQAVGPAQRQPCRLLPCRCPTSSAGDLPERSYPQKPYYRPSCVRSKLSQNRRCRRLPSG